MGSTRGPRFALDGSSNAIGCTSDSCVHANGSSDEFQNKAVLASRSRDYGTSGVYLPPTETGVPLGKDRPVPMEPAFCARYSKRNLPHFEKPWAIYYVTFSTVRGRTLAPEDRDIVLDCILYWRERRYRLFAACVMPDHVHFIIQPGIESQDADGGPVFYSLSTILHTIKSYTAHRINARTNRSGALWEKESFDRYVRSDADLEEKFHYICRNPWDSGLVPLDKPYPWLWTPDIAGSTRGTRVASDGSSNAIGCTSDSCVQANGSSDEFQNKAVLASRQNPHAGGVCSPSDGSSDEPGSIRSTRVASDGSSNAIGCTSDSCVHANGSSDEFQNKAVLASRQNAHTGGVCSPSDGSSDETGSTRGRRVASDGSTDGAGDACDVSAGTYGAPRSPCLAPQSEAHAVRVPKMALSDFVRVLDADFDGHELFRQWLLNKTHKYGNDDDYADQIAVRIFNTCVDELDGRPDPRGGHYRVEMLPTTCHVYFGSKTGALPDGRKARKPLSEGISPVQGADRNGPTAVFKSAAKFDHIKAGGTLLNMKLSPSLVSTEDGLAKWAAMIRGYFKMDAHHVQFNVVTADTLRKAQANPEQYRNLIVRVAGYSDYFCDLSRELQDEIIQRTEHVVV